MRILSLLALSVTAMAIATPPVAGANPAVFKSGGELTDACKVYTATPAAFDKTPTAADDPCRSFTKGFLVVFKAEHEARLQAMADLQTPKSIGPCIRMPDLLTYRDFAKRIVTRAGEEPGLRNGAAVALAQRTLEHDFPCPEPASAP